MCKRISEKKLNLHSFVDSLGRPGCLRKTIKKELPTFATRH